MQGQDLVGKRSKVKMWATHTDIILDTQTDEHGTQTGLYIVYMTHRHYT